MIWTAGDSTCHCLHAEGGSATMLCCMPGLRAVRAAPLACIGCFSHTALSTPDCRFEGVVPPGDRRGLFWSSGSPSVLCSIENRWARSFCGRGRCCCERACSSRSEPCLASTFHTLAPQVRRMLATRSAVRCLAPRLMTSVEDLGSSVARRCAVTDSLSIAWACSEHSYDCSTGELRGVGQILKVSGKERTRCELPVDKPSCEWRCLLSSSTANLLGQHGLCPACKAWHASFCIDCHCGLARCFCRPSHWPYRLS